MRIFDKDRIEIGIDKAPPEGITNVVIDDVVAALAIPPDQDWIPSEKLGRMSKWHTWNDHLPFNHAFFCFKFVPRHWVFGAEEITFADQKNRIVEYGISVRHKTVGLGTKFLVLTLYAIGDTPNSAPAPMLLLEPLPNGAWSRTPIPGTRGDPFLKMEDGDARLHRLLAPLAHALDLLVCDNVVLEKQERPPALAKKHLRKHGKTLRDYYFLKLLLPGKKHGSAAPSTDAPTTRPLHLTRGHFATYTETGKLFGKYTGTFWISQHMRGDESNGVLNKGYDVRPAS